MLESHRDPITGQTDLGEVETRPEPTRQHKARAKLIYKTYQPMQQPQQQSSTWDADTEARWNSWCDSRIRKMLGPDSVHFNAVAEALSLLRAELRKEFAEQLGQLRADMTVQASIQRGEITQLKGKVPLKRRSKSHKGIRAVELTLRDLPVEDRLCALLVSIIDRNPDALAVALCMLNATVTLSKGLSAERRVRIANAMRDRADTLEHRVVVPIG